MSTNLFTAEQEAFLRNNGIDTSLPIFPLSCEIAAKTVNLEELCDSCKSALNTRKNGGFKSVEEYEKACMKDILREHISSNIQITFPIALIVGEVLAWIIFVIVLVQNVKGRLLFNYPKGSWLILHGGCIALVFALVYKGLSHSTIKQRRGDIDDAVMKYKSRMYEYQRNVKLADEKYDEFLALCDEFRKLRNIITQDRAAIPQTYWSAGLTFLGIYNDRRADNVADAIAVYEDMRHKNTLEQYQARQTQLANQANIAAQEALQTARSAKASASVAVGIANSNDYRPQDRY